MRVIGLCVVIGAALGCGIPVAEPEVGGPVICNGNFDRFTSAGPECWEMEGARDAFGGAWGVNGFAGFTAPTAGAGGSYVQLVTSGSGEVAIWSSEFDVSNDKVYSVSAWRRPVVGPGTGRIGIAFYDWTHNFQGAVEETFELKDHSGEWRPLEIARAPADQDGDVVVFARIFIRIDSCRGETCEATREAHFDSVIIRPL